MEKKYDPLITAKKGGEGFGVAGSAGIIAVLICNFAESKGVEISTEAVVCGISFFVAAYTAIKNWLKNRRKK